MAKTSDKHPSRYSTNQGPEQLAQPGSHGLVLVNKLGIRSKRQIDLAEYNALVAAQKDYLSRINDGTRFTASLLCQMHYDWLGGIYEWAGRYRTVELEKSGFRWPPAFRISANMAAFEADLLAQNTPCRPGPLDNVARQIARVHAEFLLIHPFREGNGRLARWLAALMAIQAGFPQPLYGFTGRGGRARQERYLDAVTRGYLRDYDLLDAVFFKAINRRLRERDR